MKIIQNDENREKLIDLWVRVFGDEREYVKLLFPSDKVYCNSFALSEDGEIISALHLLDCYLQFNGKKYIGKYLYAAATDEKHRGKGLMSELIYEALDFCKEAKIDFVSLVPAGESLYKYYERFGFIPALKRETVFLPDEAGFDEYTEISGKEYFSVRAEALTDFISFYENSCEYAVRCLEYSGKRFYKNAYNQYFITEKNSSFFDELITDSKAMRCFRDSSVERKNCVIEKYGMLFPINPELKRDWNYEEIYMNIALD